MSHFSMLRDDPRAWRLGKGLLGQTPFMINERALSTHLAVFGGSGSGKSKLLELLCRRMLDDYRGFCFVDPHGDTTEDLLYSSIPENGKTGFPRMEEHCVESGAAANGARGWAVFGWDGFRLQREKVGSRSGRGRLSE